MEHIGFIKCFQSRWLRRDGEKNMQYCVNDVAGYHCRTCKCVMSNKGLQKPPIFKKKKKKKKINLKNVDKVIITVSASFCFEKSMGAYNPTYLSAMPV